MALNLSKQVGPLPLGVWMAVGGIGLAIGFVVNRNQSSGDNEPELEQLVESGVGTGGAQYQYTPPVSAPDSGDGSTITNNAEWGVKAANYIESLGYNGVDSNNAVAKYLVSEPLTALQKLMVNMAITRFGVPPEPLAPVDDTPVVPPGGGAAPPAVTSLRVTQATLRNDIHWSHSGQNVTEFHVLAIRLSTGKQETFWKVGARGAQTSYLHTHLGNPAWRRATAPIYEYVIRPFNGNVPGPTSRVRAPKFRTAA